MMMMMSTTSYYLIASLKRKGCHRHHPFPVIGVVGTAKSGNCGPSGNRYNTFWSAITSLNRYPNLTKVSLLGKARAVPFCTKYTVAVSGYLMTRLLHDATKSRTSLFAFRISFDQLIRPPHSVCER